jgi:hypothetical protein
MTDYYERELYSNYIDSLSQYKFRITFFLDWKKTLHNCNVFCYIVVMFSILM